MTVVLAVCGQTPLPCLPLLLSTHTQWKGGEEGTAGGWGCIVGNGVLSVSLNRIGVGSYQSCWQADIQAPWSTHSPNPYQPPPAAAVFTWLFNMLIFLDCFSSLFSIGTHSLKCQLDPKKFVDIEAFGGCVGQSSAKACWAHSRLVCMTTWWKCWRIMIESSSVLLEIIFWSSYWFSNKQHYLSLLMACCWMVKRVFLYYALNFVSWSSHPSFLVCRASNNDHEVLLRCSPLIALSPWHLKDKLKVTSISSILLKVLRSRDQSASVYQSGCSETPSLELICLVN